MTVSTFDARRSTAGNGVTTAFAAPYITDADELVVVLVNAATGVETAQILNTHYTVAGVDNQAGSTVTFLAAPSATYTVQITRDPPQLQEYHPIEGEDDPAVAKEKALDRIVFMVQALTQLAGDINNRSMRSPFGETYLTLPTIAARANRLLKFTAAGLPDTIATTAAEILLGSGVPGAGLGKDTDIYINTINSSALGDVYLKTAGAWALVTNLRGPTGPAGAVTGIPDGTLATPGWGFASETGSGARRAGAGDVRHVILGADRLRLNASGAHIYGALTLDTLLTAAELAANAVTTVKILDANVTFTKLAAAAIATADEYRAKTASKLLTADKVFDAAAFVALTDGATVTPDLATAINFSWAMAGNRTLAFPTNLKEGQVGKIRITHTGAARVWTVNASYQWTGGTDGVLSLGGAGIVDEVIYECLPSGGVKLSLEKNVS